MARRSENNALTFLRCGECTAGVADITGAISVRHNPDGTHALIFPDPRPDHGQLSVWLDVKAALNHVHQVQFYLGYLPEKPQAMWDHEAIRMQLDDARAVLERLVDGLWDQTSWPRDEAGS
ncbi:MAG TPA: hypothetical protein VN041_09265 [Microbacterium sp.]|nr:hypothetical protein [Microbacterium sp.]